MKQRIHDLVGGARDGTKYRTTAKQLPVQITLGDQIYLAIQFEARPRESDELPRMHTIYMLAGMTPQDAMQIWRERFKMDTKCHS